MWREPSEIVCIGGGALPARDTTRKQTSHIAALGRQRLWRQALEVWSELRQGSSTALHCPPVAAVDVVAYGAAISACAQGACWRGAFNLVEEMLSTGLQPTATACNAAVACGSAAVAAASRPPGARHSRPLDSDAHALRQRVAWVGAVELLAGFVALDVEVDVIALNSGVRAFSAAQRWLHAIRLAASVAPAGLEATAITLNSALDACRLGGCWRSALGCLGDVLRASLRSTIVTCNTALAACGAGMWRQAIAVAERACAALLQPDIVTLSSLALVLSDSGDASPFAWRASLRTAAAAARAADALRKHSEQAPVGVAEACARAAQWEAAIAVFMEAAPAGCEGQASFCGLLVGTCARSRVRSDLVVKLLQGENARGLRLDARALGALIGSFSSESRWEQAVAQSTDGAPSLGVELGTMACAESLNACARTSRWSVAVALLVPSSMESHGQNRDADLHASVDLPIYNAGASACVRSNSWRSALLVIQSAQASRVRLDNYMQSIELSAWETSSRWEGACGRLVELWHAAQVPSEMTLNAAISATGKGEAWELALAMVRQAQAGGSRRDAVTFNAGVTACEKGERWELGFQVMDDMQASASAPTIISYDAAISGCAKGGHWQCGLGLLGRGTAVRLELCRITCNAAISACEKRGRWSEAFALLWGARAARLQPSVVTYSATISACAKKQRWSCAVDLLHEATRHATESNAIACNAALFACSSAQQWPCCLNLVGLLRVAPPPVGFLNGRIDRRVAAVEPDALTFGLVVMECEQRGFRRGEAEFLEGLVSSGVACLPANALV